MIISVQLLRFATQRLTAGFAFAALLLGLSACNTGSLTDGLRPVAPAQPLSVSQQPLSENPPNQTAANTTALAAEQAPRQTAQATIRAQQPAEPANLPPVAFLPVTGAPQPVVASLAKSMRDAARQETVPIVVSVDQGAQYQVKGYFSALNDGNGTLLVYVWDVLDRKGTRVHRISGQERGGKVSGDPWKAVTPTLLDKVARQTMGSLRGWIGRSARG